jgi:glutathione S-transferase
MILYGSTDSGHSYKIRSFLLMSQTDHQYQWVDLSQARLKRQPEFIAASKFGEVPVVIDQGHALCQSNAILSYLAEKTNKFRGNEAEWQSILEWLSWETNRIGFSVPNLRFALRWSPQPPDVLAYLRKRVVADLEALDAILSSTSFLLASGPSIADISCSAYLFWLSDIGVEESQYPHIQKWLNALRALPGWIHPDEAMKADITN